MRRLLFATVALGGFTALSTLGAAAAPNAGVVAWHSAAPASVVQADWYWNHHHWHHRRWSHHGWHYWD